MKTRRLQRQKLLALVAGSGVLAGATGCRKPASPAPPAAPPPAAAIRFEDVAAERGVRFTHYTGADGRYYMPESIGSGGAFLDVDGDGWLDLLLLNNTNWPDRPAAGKTAALYQNQKDGTFREITREAGLAFPFYGFGCAVGDYDNDGRDDLLLTGMSGNRLLRNMGGRFQDMTRGSGLENTARWGYYTSAAWFDYDRDGRLDLFVCRYVDWTPQKDVPCHSGSGKRIYCGPNWYGPVPSLLYRNLGGGRFQDVSTAAGIAAVTGKGLGVLPFDENGDGWTDLMVTNDTTPNHLFRNQKGKKFTEVAQAAAIAVDDSGRARAGMGVDVADIRNDGSFAFSIGNFSNEGLSLYEHTGEMFVDQAQKSGLATPSLPNVTFGLLFLDADRDGQQDLFTANGHVDQQAAEAGGAVTYRQAAQLFRNEKGEFTEIGSQAGESFRKPLVGRGCAWGDFDNDGRPDLLLCENGGPARLLRNRSEDRNHWLGIRLKGSRSNRNGYGAEVRVTTGGVTQRRWVRSGGSYLSHSDARALFGLGAAGQVDRLEILWPSGRKSVQEQVEIDRYLEVVEPSG